MYRITSIQCCLYRNWLDFMDKPKSQILFITTGSTLRKMINDLVLPVDEFSKQYYFQSVERLKNEELKCCIVSSYYTNNQLVKHQLYPCNVQLYHSALLSKNKNRSSNKLTRVPQILVQIFDYQDSSDSRGSHFRPITVHVASILTGQ